MMMPWITVRDRESVYHPVCLLYALGYSQLSAYIFSGTVTLVQHHPSSRDRERELPREQGHNCEQEERTMSAVLPLTPRDVRNAGRNVLHRPTNTPDVSSAQVAACGGPIACVVMVCLPLEFERLKLRLAPVEIIPKIINEAYTSTRSELWWPVSARHV